MCLSKTPCGRINAAPLFRLSFCGSIGRKSIAQRLSWNTSEGPVANMRAFFTFRSATLLKNAEGCPRGPAFSWGMRNDVTAVPENFEPSSPFQKTSWVLRQKSGPRRPI